MSLTSVSIRRPVFILMVVSALIVLGLYSMSRMKLELNPNVDFPFVSITTSYPGAGPAEVETQVTKKIEDAVAGVNGIKTLTSSSQEGISAISIQFVLGTNSATAASDVREKVGGVRGDLPVAVREPVIQQLDFNSQPILYYGLVGKRPSRDLRDMADNVIKARLSKVSGVGAVSVTGGDVRGSNVHEEAAQARADGNADHRDARRLLRAHRTGAVLRRERLGAGALALERVSQRLDRGPLPLRVTSPSAVDHLEHQRLVMCIGVPEPPPPHAAATKAQPNVHRRVIGTPLPPIALQARALERSTLHAAGAAAREREADDLVERAGERAAARDRALHERAAVGEIRVRVDVEDERLAGRRIETHVDARVVAAADRLPSAHRDVLDVRDHLGLEILGGAAAVHRVEVLAARVPLRAVRDDLRQRRAV